MKRTTWRQISGDMNPDKYGAIIARWDGKALELLEIQPVAEYVGENEAVAVGFPFWSREAWYDPSDLDPARPDVVSALKCCGLDLAEVEPKHRPMAIAECLMRYGSGVDESTAGWARDVLGKRRVVWWASNGKAIGWRFLKQEDQEQRRRMREARRAA